jgi:hypothetical protein
MQVVIRNYEHIKYRMISHLGYSLDDLQRINIYDAVQQIEIHDTAQTWERIHQAAYHGIDLTDVSVSGTEFYREFVYQQRLKQLPEEPARLDPDEASQVRDGFEKEIERIMIKRQLKPVKDKNNVRKTRT